MRRKGYRRGKFWRIAELAEKLAGRKRIGATKNIYRVWTNADNYVIIILKYK